MKKAKLAGHNVEFYDDIATLPVDRFHTYSRYILVASGVGDTLSSIDTHIGRISKLISFDPKKAQQELLNLRQNLYLVANEEDVTNKAFLALVNSVDGKPWADFSDDGINSLYALLNKESVREFGRVADEVIGKIDEELERYFPEIFNSSADKNRVDLMRKRALLQADEMRRDVDHTKEIDDLTRKIFEYYKPKDFEGDKAVVEFDRQFEEMCLILTKEFAKNAKDYSVMEFYSAYNLLTKQQKEIKKLSKKK